MDSLPFAKQCKEPDAEFLKFSYESKLKKYQAPSDYNILASCGELVSNRSKTNLDMQVSEAERLYYNCDYYKGFSITENNKIRSISQWLPANSHSVPRRIKKNKWFVILIFVYL